MQDSNKLIKLVEQAACSINMLDPTDLSELDKLQKILEQIDESIVEISDGPATLLQEAKGTTADASEALYPKMAVPETPSHVPAPRAGPSTVRGDPGRRRAAAGQSASCIKEPTSAPFFRRRASA